MELQFPVHLNKRVVETIVDDVVKMMLAEDGPFASYVQQDRFHVVVSCDARNVNTGEVVTAVLCERSYEMQDGEFGLQTDISDWPDHGVHNIARSKNQKMREGRHDSTHTANAHRLLPGDTRYWGNDERGGLKTSASGEESEIDMAVCEAINTVLIALCAVQHKTMVEAEQIGTFV